MEAPDKIFVEFSDDVNLAFEVQPFEETPAYIRKDALLEWLLKGVEMSEICHSEYGDACAQAYQAVIDKINSM